MKIYIFLILIAVLNCGVLISFDFRRQLNARTEGDISGIAIETNLEAKDILLCLSPRKLKTCWPFRTCNWKVDKTAQDKELSFTCGDKEILVVPLNVDQDEHSNLIDLQKLSLFTYLRFNVYPLLLKVLLKSKQMDLMPYIEKLAYPDSIPSLQEIQAKFTDYISDSVEESTINTMLEAYNSYLKPIGDGSFTRIHGISESLQVSQYKKTILPEGVVLYTGQFFLTCAKTPIKKEKVFRRRKHLY
jgi:hypothetical protein